MGSRPQRGLRYVLTLAAVAGLYLVAGKLGLKLASVHASATAVWAPTGIALAAILVLGYRLCPGVFLGAFLVNITTQGSVASCMGIAAGNTLEALVGAYLVNRFARGRQVFDHPQDVFRFVGLAGLVATTVSATFGVTSQSLAGYADWAQYGSIWLTWWLGDAGGALVVAPVLILWMGRPRLPWRRGQELEAVLLMGSLLLVTQLAFSDWLSTRIRDHPLAFLCVPVLLWAALRFGPRETATANLLLAGLATWNTLLGRGSFARESQNESLLLLQAFMGVVSVMTLVLAAAVEERRRAETGLRESEDRVRKILDSSLDAVIIMDPQGRITDWNPQAEKIFGWTRAEAVDRLIWDTIFAARQRERHREELEKCLTSGRGSFLNKRLEMTALRRDGPEFPAELAVVPVRVEQAAFFSVFVRDISDRKKAEESIRLYSNLVENIQIGFSVYRLEDAADDRTLRMVAMNPAAARMSKLTPRDVLGKTLDEISPGARKSGMPRKFADVVRGGTATEIEEVFYRDARIAGAYWSFRAIPLPDHCVGVAFEDVSARKQAEGLLLEHLKEIERLNVNLAEQKAELSTYHSLVTHDVTNFCATLQAVVERLLLQADGTLTPKQEELLRRANRQAFEMNRLSENAKLLFRLREKGLPASSDRVPVYGVLQRVLDTLRSVHFDRPFRVEIECPEGIAVSGVPFVENIFLNLVDNAVRYSERGAEPQIRIRIGPEDGRVNVTVRGGAAVEEGFLTRMFDRYARGPHSTGTGLGLALIREIVERSGGEVRAGNSAEGPEEVFEVVLSLPRA